MRKCKVIKLRVDTSWIHFASEHSRSLRLVFIETEFENA